MPNLEVIRGQRDEATHVCTWCGEKFVTRAGLEEHWDRDPHCRSNRNVSSPLRPDAVPFGTRIVPGEHTLSLVRAKEEENESKPSPK